MAKDIPFKTTLDEGDAKVFRRFQTAFGWTEAMLLRRAFYFYEDHHSDVLDRHETRRRSAMRAPKKAINGT